MVIHFLAIFATTIERAPTEQSAERLHGVAVDLVVIVAILMLLAALVPWLIDVCTARTRKHVGQPNARWLRRMRSLARACVFVLLLVLILLILLIGWLGLYLPPHLQIF
jgi:hypothetical protein